MLDSVIELPRQLSRVRDAVRCANYMAYEPPTSPFGKAIGVSCDIIDLPICIGNRFDILTGRDAFHRYKLMEHTPTELHEYVCVSDEPYSSGRGQIFTLWLNIVDKTTLKLKRVYFWNNIAHAREYFSMPSSESLNDRARSDVNFIMKLFFPHVPANMYYTGGKYRYYPTRDELDDVCARYSIIGNAAAAEDCYANEQFYMVHPGDLFRGALPDEQPIDLSKRVGRVLASGPVAPRTIKKMLGPPCGCEYWHKPLKPINESTTIDQVQEFNGWFSVLKYIELIPYGELFMLIRNGKFEVIRAFDPYDRIRTIDIDPRTADEELNRAFLELLSDLDDLLPNTESVSIYRSWSEEVYITSVTKDRKTERFYFDLVYSAIGSRMFVSSN